MTPPAPENTETENGGRNLGPFNLAAPLPQRGGTIGQGRNHARRVTQH